MAQLIPSKHSLRQGAGGGHLRGSQGASQPGETSTSNGSLQCAIQMLSKPGYREERNSKCLCTPRKFWPRVESEPDNVGARLYPDWLDGRASNSRDNHGISALESIGKVISSSYPFKEEAGVPPAQEIAEAMLEFLQ